MRCVLGFDGGGTKTDCVLMDETGAIRARTRSGPSNPILVGVDAAATVLIEAAEKAFAIAATSSENVRFVMGAVAGASAARDLVDLIVKLREKFENAQVLIDSDAKMALEATGEIPSIVVIAGTGSVVCGRSFEEEPVREGGLGAILGDPGSAYDIGRKTVIAEWRRTLDGEDSRLTNEILEHFACDWQALQARLRADASGVLPRIFPLVTRAANENDVTAQELLRSSAEELTVLVERVVTRLHLSGEAFFLAKTGGVFGHSRYFDEPFDQRVRVIAPNARIGALPVLVAEYAAQVALACLEDCVEQVEE